MQRIQGSQIYEQHPMSDLFKKIETQMGFVLNDGLLMAHTPHIAQAFAGLTEAILRKGNISGTLKRLIGLVSSLSSGCRYCVSHTSYSASKMNLEDEKLQAVWNFQTSALFDEKEKAVLHVASKAGMCPNQVEDEDIINLQNFYSNEEIVEIVSTISFYGFLNRFNQTLNTDIEDVPAKLLQKLNK